MTTTANVVASVRRLSRLSERLPASGALHDALAAELLSLLGLEELHLQHLPDGARPELAVSYQPGDPGARQPYSLPEDAPDSGVAWVAATGRALVAPPGSALGPELVGRFQRAAAALLPVTVDARVCAVAILIRRRALGDDELELARTLVEVAANALALVEARAAARTDSLTGLMNYGAMVGRLDEEIDRARRQGSALACLLVDVDDFKYINDRYGHLIGDGILRQVAATLRHEFRRFDRVARYGGDEFVVILPNAEGNRGAVAGERALRRLREIQVEGAGEDYGLTASIGLAAWEPPETASDLLAKADFALRQVKQTGKDRLEDTGATAINGPNAAG